MRPYCASQTASPEFPLTLTLTSVRDLPRSAAQRPCLQRWSCCKGDRDSASAPWASRYLFASARSRASFLSNFFLSRCEIACMLDARGEPVVCTRCGAPILPHSRFPPGDELFSWVDSLTVHLSLVDYTTDSLPANLY